MNISSPINLENLIKDSNTVVYFTHDYFSDVPEKNEQLVQTAEICKAYDIKKFIAVNPIEYINYYTDDDLSNDPYTAESKAQDEALYYF